jgi:hypothetical protein
MTTETAAAQPLPLFYREPQPLNATIHASWSLREGDHSFAGDTLVVPVVAGELAAVMAHYPIVFVGEAPWPVAFVRNGRWIAGSYIPAYVRRYPFGFTAAGDSESYALAIDTASARVDMSGDEGAKLFEDGKPSALSQHMLDYCAIYQREAEATAAFCKALAAHDLLVDQQAAATLPDGRQFTRTGFKVIDPARFKALDGATVVEWHHKEWLGLIHFHLASLARFQALVERMGTVAARDERP